MVRGLGTPAERSGLPAPTSAQRTSTCNLRRSDVLSWLPQVFHPYAQTIRAHTQLKIKVQAPKQKFNLNVSLVK